MLTQEAEEGWEGIQKQGTVRLFQSHFVMFASKLERKIIFLIELLISYYI